MNCRVDYCKDCALFSVIGQLPSPKSCEHGRRIFSDGTTWEHDCNACRCDNGEVKCTKVISLKCKVLGFFYMFWVNWTTCLLYEY